jgi:hypothetical protein
MNVESKFDIFVWIVVNTEFRKRKVIPISEISGSIFSAQ